VWFDSKAVAIVGALVMTVLSVVPTAAADNVSLVDAVVAAVDGVPITLMDFENFTKGRGRLLSNRDRSSREALLRAMIELELFNAEFSKQGIFADDRDTEDYIDRILAQSRSDRGSIKRALADIGLEWSDYFERMRVEVEKLALMNREIRTRANVTPEEVERFWRNSEEFKLPERVKVAHIFVPLVENGKPIESQVAEARVAEAADLARRDFAKAARLYSSGPTADEGGVLGVFDRGSMALLFEREIAKLEDGDVSEPFEVDGAVHILKRVETFAPGRVELAKVEDKIRGRLYDEMIEERYKHWVADELWTRHHVVNNLASIDTLLERSDLDPS